MKLNETRIMAIAYVLVFIAFMALLTWGIGGLRGWVWVFTGQ